jgi:hypothetical protein
MKSFKQYTEACWTGYTAKGMKKKGDRMVPNCVPVKEDGMGAAAAGAPANNVGAGNIAGTGGKAGEPGVSKKRKSPITFKMARRTPPNL